MNPNKNKPKQKRGAKPVLLWLLFFTLLFVLTFLILITHPAKNYQPRPLTESERKTTEEQLWQKSEIYYNQLQIPGSFIIEFEQDFLNRLLLHKDTEIYLQKLNLPITDRLRYPQVTLKNQAIELIAQTRYKALPITIRINLPITLDPAGNLILQKPDFHAGLLPIPNKTIQQRIERLLTNEIHFNEQDQSKEIQKLAKSAQTKLQSLFQQGRVTFPAAYNASKNKQIQIKALDINPARLQLQLQVTQKSEKEGTD